MRRLRPCELPSRYLRGAFPGTAFANLRPGYRMAKRKRALVVEQRVAAR